MDGRLRELDFYIPTSCAELLTFLSTRLQTNCLSTFQLALSLLPLMDRTADAHYSGTANTMASPATSLVAPHLTIVSSGMMFMNNLPERKLGDNILATLNDPEKFDLSSRYPATKLIEAFFVRSLARRHHGHRVVINYASPGFCHSGVRYLFLPLPPLPTMYIKV